jgi:hypothetical protein
MHECRKQYASEILLQKNCSETEDQLILITIKLAEEVTILVYIYIFSLLKQLQHLNLNESKTFLAKCFILALS